MLNKKLLAGAALPAHSCPHGYRAPCSMPALPSCSRYVIPSMHRSSVMRSMAGAVPSPHLPEEATTAQLLQRWDRTMIAVSSSQPAPAASPPAAAAAAGPGPSSEEARRSAAPSWGSGDADLLWAGYSDVSEQLRRLHARHSELQLQVETLTQRLHTQQQHSPPVHGSIAATTAAAMASWQAASFLFLFLCFINVAGFIASLKAGFFMPPFLAAAKPAVEMLWLKGLLSVALPITNTAVILIFCLQAVKAAWACVRW